MLIRVRVFPNSKKEGIVQKSENRFEIMVKEKPVGGLANQAVFKILSSYFKIPESKIKIIKGFKNRSKIIQIP